MSPAEASAELSLGAIVTSDLPDLATRWLVAGLDCPSLGELAGHPRFDAWGLQALWAQVCEELDLVAVPSPEEALGHAVRHELRRWRNSELSAQDFSARLLAMCEYGPSEVIPELSELRYLREELEGGWGRLPKEIDRDLAALIASWAEAMLGAST